jgi:hypothetical protein
MSGTVEPKPQLGRQKIERDIQLRLGSGIIDNELDPEHIDYAIRSAIGRYRMRSGNSMEESFIFMDTQPDVQAYTLPSEVQEVRALYRRSIGGTAGGAAVDPFSLAFTNNIYMIQNPGALGTSGSGMLATYDFAMQYQELIGRMFGRDVLYTFDVATKRLTLHRRFTAVETIAIHVYNIRPDEVLFADPYSYGWLKDYAIATCKLIMGEARGKFQSLGGPQGGVSLNGDALKAEAKEDMERLENEIVQFMDSHDGMPIIIG